MARQKQVYMRKEVRLIKSRGKLTDDDLAQVEGKEEQLLGILQKRYGYAKEKAEEEYKEFIGRYGRPPSGEKIK